MTPEEYDRHYRKGQCGCRFCKDGIIKLSDEHYRLMRMQEEKNKQTSKILNLIIEKSQKEAAILAEYERQMKCE